MKFYFIPFILVFNSLLFAGQSPHGNLNFPCENCHVTANWQIDLKSMTFNHDRTGYPLDGAHRQAGCRDCHQKLVFQHVGATCVDCHTDIHRGQLGIRCESCHITASWENRQTLFEQHFQTRFPLLGAHARLDCEACHGNQHEIEFANTPLECLACHVENFHATTNPNHARARFSTTCEECHPVQAFTWQQVTYLHAAAFPLKGAHKLATCVDCHSQTYQGTANACFACHEPDYSSTTDPNHRAFGFLTDCKLCHNDRSWNDAIFDHFLRSGFDLIGAHHVLQCNLCHINNRVNGLPRDCFGCHESDYNATADPNHLAGQYPHDCTICHNVNAWSPANFNHNLTAFPLTGAHQGVDCEDCHVNNVYTGIPTDCYSCHRPDFQAATDPNHVANNFDHNCSICHSTSAWEPATFDHNATAFPLTGAHATTACTNCHENGYTNTPTDCFFCHELDYKNTTDPNHAVAQFPQNCQECHNTSNWNQTTWNHDSQYFPIYSGAHQGEWGSCTDCHINPADYQAFECINCHEHNKSDTDRKHNEVRNYQYLSSACYDCHPKGRGDD